VVLALTFFVLWGVVQSYTVFKAESIWVASFLHGLVNSMYAYSLSYLVRPADRVWSFGLGVYGLLCLAVVVLLLLRDPVWNAPAEEKTAEALTVRDRASGPIVSCATRSPMSGSA